MAVKSNSAAYWISSGADLKAMGFRGLESSEKKVQYEALGAHGQYSMLSLVVHRVSVPGSSTNNTTAVSLDCSWQHKLFLQYPRCLKALIVKAPDEPESSALTVARSRCTGVQNDSLL
jgi:hypothetical protein